LEEAEALKKPFFSEEKKRERRGGKKIAKNKICLILNPNLDVHDSKERKCTLVATFVRLSFIHGYIYTVHVIRCAMRA
jgi:hypothetical protein